VKPRGVHTGVLYNKRRPVQRIVVVVGGLVQLLNGCSTRRYARQFNSLALIN